MKKTLLFLVLILFGINTSAQCWKSADLCSGIKTDGTLWKWGGNEFGQIGDGTTVDQSSPVKIGTDFDWKEVISNGTTSFAIKTDGTLWAWGRNNYGQIGDGTNVNRHTPLQIGNNNNWKSISSTAYHCLAVKTDGTLWAWGNNSFGQIGDGTNVDKKVPIQVGTDTDWQIATTGHYHSLAIKTNGTLWGWGYNNSGQLGLGDAVNRNVPYQIGMNNDWMTIKAYGYNSYALKTNGTLWSWGRNVDYELGDGTLTNRLQPMQIGVATNWDKLGIRCARKSDGTLWGWGYNLTGDLGDGTNVTKTIPTQIGTDTDWFSPYNNSIKLKIDGTLWISGNNQRGNLGVGNQIPLYTSTYNLVQILTTNCLPLTIANDDSGTTLNGIASTSIANVLTNDTFNGNPATLSNVTLFFISSTHSGITLNTSTGAVNVSATVPVGTYTLNYQICQTTSLSNCDTATVTITVNPQTIDAINDNFSSTPIDYLTGGITPSLLANDIVNGSAANPADVILTLTNNGGIAGASINVNGGIDVPVGTLINTYTLQYSICLVSNPSICDTATVTVTVADRVITTPEIAFAIRANNAVDKSELQSTGKIIISGGFTKYNNVDAKHLMRLNTDLTHDTSFLALGSLPYEPEDFKVLSNDKIIVVGTFTSINGIPTARGIARLNADGTVDTSFNVGGTGLSNSSDRIMSCAVQSDGKILLGGGFIRSYNGVPTRNMIRLNSDGTLDTSFVYPYTYAPSTFGSIYKIVVQPDGKILVSGHQSRATDALGNYIGQPHIFRLNTDGSLDSTFTTSFVDYTHSNTNFCSSCIAPIQNMILQPDGKIIIVGSFVSFNYIRRRDNIVRLNSNGTLDHNFLANRSHTTSNRAIKDAVIEPSGKIIIGGEFTTFNGLTTNKLARLNTDGTIDTTFSSGDGPTFGTYLGTVYDLNRQADGKVIVSGSFSHYNTISATNITRIAPEIPGSQARGNGLQLWNTEKEIENSFQATGEISIYPNPSTGIFTFDLTQTKEKFAMITIYNALGQKVYQKNSIPEAINEIDMSNLPSGYYYAQITGDNSTVQKVLMKK